MEVDGDFDLGTRASRRAAKASTVQRHGAVFARRSLRAPSGAFSGTEADELPASGHALLGHLDHRFDASVARAALLDVTVAAGIVTRAATKE
jgi:hypothetical protein